MHRSGRFPLLLLVIILFIVPLLIQAQDDDDLEIPMPGGVFVPLVPENPDNAIVMPDGTTLIIGTAQVPTEELIEYPVTPGAESDPCAISEAESEEDLIIPVVGCPPIPTSAPTQPPQPIGLVRGFYRQVGTPSVTTEGQCFDATVGVGGSCAADAGGRNEVYDFNNCWSEDADADGDGVRDERLIPACQSPDTETLFLYDQNFLYGRLTGSAYGRASMNRTMLEQGGVSIGTYSVLQGTQIEVLSPTRFVVRQVHREAGGCTEILNTYYELAEQSEAACQQVIEVTPVDVPEEPISTPPPLPPIKTEPYTVAMPIIPDTCTEDTLPPADFTQAQLALDDEQGTLTVSYGSGAFTTYQSLGSTFSYVDHRENAFRLDFTLYEERIGMHWYKTGANGASCALEGELRPISYATPSASAADSPMAVIESEDTYSANWTVPITCTPEMFASLPTFTQATLTAQQEGFTIDYGTGSYTLNSQDGNGFYTYTVTGEDGSMTVISLNSFTAETFALLYLNSDAAGNMCMANLDLSR